MQFMQFIIFMQNIIHAEYYSCQNGGMFSDSFA